MNNLKNAVGLLNAQAPEGEFLAYINPKEAKMLKDAGGSGLLTPQGIPSYFSAMYGGGAGDRGGDPRASASENRSAGRDDRGNVQRAEDYRRQQNQTNTPPTVIEEPTFTGEVQDTTNLADPPKGKLETFFDDVKEFFAGGGIVGNVAKGVVDFIAPISGAIQKKAIKYSLNKKLEKIYKDNPDFEDYESEGEIPGLIGVDVRDLQRDLRGLEDGTFTQKDYTAKYGSGDGTNPLDASFNPATLRDDERSELETIFAPELAYAIGGTTPQNSMVNQYFANTNNQNLGISSDYMTTYNKAKADLAKTLNMTANADQFGYSGTMTASNIYYNYLKEQGLL